MPRITVVALVLAVTAAPLFACDDGNTSQPPSFDIDAGDFDTGTPQTPDAAAPVDSGVDATPRGIIVNAIRGRQPMANVRVLFHDAQGAVIGDQRTDATGRTTRAEAPSMVTVITENGVNGMRLLTYLGVEDGDVLTARIALVEDAALGQFNVSYPAHDGSVGYDISAADTCSNWRTETLGILPMYSDCVGATAAHVLVRAESGGGVHHYSFAKGLTAPAGGAEVNVPTLPAFTASLPITLSATGIPVDSTIYSGTLAVLDGLPYFTGFSDGSLTEGGETWAFPNGFADAIQTYALTFSYEAEEPFGQAVVRRDAAPTAATSVAFDWATALPRLTSFTATPSAATPQRPTIAVGPATATTGIDGGYLQFEWGVTPEGTEDMVYPQWTFVVPPGTTSLQPPVLPPDFTQAPTATSELWTIDAAFVEATHLPGYAQLKTLPVPVSGYVMNDLIRRPLPANGVLRLSFRSYAFGKG